MSDYISRADAIEAVCGHCKNKKLCDDYLEERCPYRVKLSALPSADVVSREQYHNLLTATEDIDRALREYQAKEEQQADAVQGEWEHWGSPFSDESEVIDTIVCSVCGARFIEPKDEPKGEYNYCPNCGAKMKGGDYE